MEDYDYHFIFPGYFNQTIFNDCNIPPNLNNIDKRNLENLIRNKIFSLSSVFNILVNIPEYSGFINFTTSNKQSYKYKITLKNHYIKIT